MVSLTAEDNITARGDNKIANDTINLMKSELCKKDNTCSWCK